MLLIYNYHFILITFLYHFVPYRKDRGSIPSIKTKVVLSFKSFSCTFLTAWTLKLLLETKFTALPALCSPSLNEQGCEEVRKSPSILNLPFNQQKIKLHTTPDLVGTQRSAMVAGLQFTQNWAVGKLLTQVLCYVMKKS